MKNPLKWLFKVKRVTANNQTHIYICYNIDRWWIGAELLHHYGIEIKPVKIIRNYSEPPLFTTIGSPYIFINKPTFIKYV